MRRIVVEGRQVGRAEKRWNRWTWKVEKGATYSRPRAPTFSPRQLDECALSMYTVLCHDLSTLNSPWEYADDETGAKYGVGVQPAGG